MHSKWHFLRGKKISQNSQISTLAPKNNKNELLELTAELVSDLRGDEGNGVDADIGMKEALKVECTGKLFVIAGQTKRLKCHCITLYR